MHATAVLVLISCASCCYGFALANRVRHASRLYDSTPEKEPSKDEIDSPTLKALFGNDNFRVKWYVDGEEPLIELKESDMTSRKRRNTGSRSTTSDSSSSSKYIIKPSSTSSNIPVAGSSEQFLQSSYLEIPLLPFETPLFPGSREFLFIYEMRFRSLFQHVAKSKSGLLGRCFVSDDDGRIASIASICKVNENKQLDDGKGFYIIEATERVRIVKILRTEPYLTALVETRFGDEEDALEDVDLHVQEQLCEEVYSNLKAYLRLAKLQTYVAASNGEGGGEAGEKVVQTEAELEVQEEEREVFTPAVRDSRPCASVRAKEKCPSDTMARHARFSFAVANLLSTESEIMQQIFQSTSCTYRLHGLKRILAEAVSEVSSLLVDDNLLSELELDKITKRARTLDDNDDDLMPPVDYEGVTLASELDESLAEELGLDLQRLFASTETVVQEILEKEEGDDWDVDAFQ